MIALGLDLYRVAHIRCVFLCLLFLPLSFLPLVASNIGTQSTKSDLLSLLLDFPVVVETVGLVALTRSADLVMITGLLVMSAEPENVLVLVPLGMQTLGLVPLAFLTVSL